MAEALGIAASVVSLVAFAGQLAQSATFLYTIFKDIQNAPADVNRLYNELQIVSSILTTIQRSSTTHGPDLQHALEHSNAVISDLLAMVRSLEQSDITKKRERLWNMFKMVLRRSELSTHLGALERCKSMLLQCCSTESMCESQSDIVITRYANQEPRAAQTRHADALNEVQDALDRLLIQQSDHTTSIVRNVATVGSLKDSLSRVGDSQWASKQPLKS